MTLLTSPRLSPFRINCLALAFFYNNLNSLKSYNERIEHTQEVLDNVQDVQHLLTEAENSQRGFVITGDSTYITNVEEFRKKINAETEDLKGLFYDNRKQQEL